MNEQIADAMVKESTGPTIAEICRRIDVPEQAFCLGWMKLGSVGERSGVHMQSFNAPPRGAPDRAGLRIRRVRRGNLGFMATRLRFSEVTGRLVHAHPQGSSPDSARGMQPSDRPRPSPLEWQQHGRKTAGAGAGGRGRTRGITSTISSTGSLPSRPMAGRLLEMMTYGEVVDAGRLEEFFDTFFEANLRNEAATMERPTPLCIWGPHGLGKTASVMAFARARNWKLAYCAPAQFEEMGDLHGLPMRVAPEAGRAGDGYTAYLPPEWVPREQGPGILLLDDINRADDRILRGLMQLLQNFAMFSWSLPGKWQIVCTANPEGGDYAVTTMDDAMLTRMLHISLRFDPKAWARWAVSAGVDPRGIDFVLTYPEIVTGRRTTPRSLVQVFAHLQDIKDWKADLGRVSLVANGGLDQSTVGALLAYVSDDLHHLVQASDILGAKSFEDVKPRIVAAARGSGGAVRVDRLSAILTRVVIALAGPEHARFDARTKANVLALLKMDELPADLRFSAHRDISSLPGGRAALVQDKAMAKLVLGAI